jgi:flagellin-like protein
MGIVPGMNGHNEDHRNFPSRRNAMKRFMESIRRGREERGITGLETAIVLIAFVVVAAVFAFVVLSTGLFSSERGKETVYAGLQKTRGSMALTGGVIATSDGTQITDLSFGLTLAAGGDAVNLDQSDANNRTVISYIDSAVIDNDLAYTTTEVVGDTDELLASSRRSTSTSRRPAPRATSRRTRRSRWRSSRRLART